MGILNSQLGKRLLGLEDATKQNILGTKFQMSQSILSCGEHCLVGWMDNLWLPGGQHCGDGSASHTPSLSGVMFKQTWVEVLGGSTLLPQQYMC